MFFILYLTCNGLILGQYFDKDFGNKGVLSLDDFENCDYYDVVADTDGNIYVVYKRYEFENFKSRRSNLYSSYFLVKYNEYGERYKKFGEFGKLARRVFHPPGELTGANFSIADGKIISYAMYSSELIVKVYDLNGKALHSYNIVEENNIVECLPFGNNLIYLCSDGKVVMMEDGGEMLWEKSLYDTRYIGLRETENGVAVYSYDDVLEETVNVCEIDLTHQLYSAEYYMFSADSSFFLHQLTTLGDYYSSVGERRIKVSSYKQTEINLQILSPANSALKELWLTYYSISSLKRLRDSNYFLSLFCRNSEQVDSQSEDVQMANKKCIDCLYSFTDDKGNPVKNFGDNGYFESPMSGKVKQEVVIAVDENYVYVRSDASIRKLVLH